MRYKTPRYFMHGKMYGYTRGVDSNSYLTYIGSRIVSLKAEGISSVELIDLWSEACMQVVLSAHRNIKVAKDFCSKDKHAYSVELQPTWEVVFHRELRAKNAKSIKELDEKDLIKKTYIQFFTYISNTIKNCELLPVNEKTRNEVELLKEECRGVLQDNYNSLKPTIKLLSETELFSQCQSNKSYGDYLDCYPNGEYSQKAKRAMNKKGNILGVVAVVVGIALFGFLFYCLFVRGDWRYSLILMGAGFVCGIISSIRQKIGF